MDPYGAQIVAASRSEDYVREAASERIARAVRGNRQRNSQAEPRARAAPRQREVARPVIA